MEEEAKLYFGKKGFYRRRYSSLWCCHSNSSLRDHQDPVGCTSNQKESARLMREMHSLQLQGELQAKKDAPRLYKGAFHGVGVVLKNEGPKGLYRGIGAAVIPMCQYRPSTQI